MITGTPLYAGKDFCGLEYARRRTGGNARHAITDLIQFIPELEKAAVAAWNAFVGAQRPPKFQRE
jgi:hypothetical protein